MTSSDQKSILFLSGSDFKEKSIQVIRKTPEAYVKAGWRVVYVVGRDNSKAGNYFYEQVINPEGIEIIRFQVPLGSIHELFESRYWQAFWFRVRNLLLVLGLAIQGIRQLRNHSYDILYGYEIPGVLAGAMVRALGFRKPKFVTRFQGVLYVKEWLRTGQRLRVLSNFEAFMALRTKSDLCIMTNDGSQGLTVLKQVGGDNKKVLFYTNGVDEIHLNQDKLNAIREKYYFDSGKKYLLSVSRLDPHKRIDRSIRIISHLVKTLKVENIRFIVVGEGAEHDRLSRLISSLELEAYVGLIGAVNHDEVKYHFECADIFLSMYTSTNVGNPLLEAIKANKLIVTLSNGDTGEWISHRENGLIYPVDDVSDLTDSNYAEIARDLQLVLGDQALMHGMKQKLLSTAKTKLWSWTERLSAEVKEVSQLVI
jgi:glycosyltransferase involved in cell wall biosynthesis